MPDGGAGAKTADKGRLIIIAWVRVVCNAFVPSEDTLLRFRPFVNRKRNTSGVTCYPGGLLRADAGFSPSGAARD
jgi:hypothetical protein